MLRLSPPPQAPHVQSPAGHTTDTQCRLAERMNDAVLCSRTTIPQRAPALGAQGGRGLSYCTTSISTRFWAGFGLVWSQPWCWRTQCCRGRSRADAPRKVTRLRRAHRAACPGCHSARPEHVAGEKRGRVCSGRWGALWARPELAFHPGQWGNEGCEPGTVWAAFHPSHAVTAQAS